METLRRPAQTLAIEPEAAPITPEPNRAAETRFLSRWSVPMLLVGVGVVAATYAPLSIDLGDEGFLAHNTQRVMQGELPHRDFYSLQGPLSSFLAAAWSTVFGLSFLKLRLLGVVLHAAMVLLTYSIARRFASPAWALAAGALAMLVGLPHMHFAPLAVWQGIALSLAAVALALHSIRRPDGKLAFASGIVAAFSVLARHDQGAYLVIAILVLAVALRAVPGTRLAPGPRFKLGAWMLGVAVIAVPAFLFFWASGALPAMWDQLVLFPLTRYSATSALPMPNLGQEGPTGSLMAFVAFRFAPLFATTALVLVGIRSRRAGYGEREAIGLFLAIWTMLFYLQVTVRSDLAHLVLTMAPMLALMAWLPGYAIRAFGKEGEQHKQWRLGISALGSMGFAGMALVAWHMLLPASERQAQPIASAQAGIFETEATEINAVLASIAQHSATGDALLALPYHPAFYVLADRRNPTRWGYHWPGDRNTEEQQQLIAQVAQDPPAVVVIFNRDSTATYLGPVVQWVEAHYVPIDAQADPVIYRPRTP